MVQISIRVDTSSNHVYISIASVSPLPGLAENIVFIIKYMDIGDCMFNVVRILSSGKGKFRECTVFDSL